MWYFPMSDQCRLKIFTTHYIVPYPLPLHQVLHAVFQVSATVFITIEDINDNTPTFQNTPYQTRISEVRITLIDLKNDRTFLCIYPKMCGKLITDRCANWDDVQYSYTPCGRPHPSERFNSSHSLPKLGIQLNLSANATMGN